MRSLIPSFGISGALLLAAALTGADPFPAAAAETYPSRPVTLIVSFPAGGLADAYARGTARIAEKELGQPIVVENRSGAMGLLGANAALRAQPDGYTLFQATITQFRAPYISKVAFDPTRDFTYIIGMSDFDHAMFVPTASAFKRLSDVIAAARDKPGDVSIGSPGMGGSAHLILQDLAVKAGVKFNHIPFKGAPEAVTNAIGGHLQTIIIPYNEGRKYADRLRLVAIFGEKRAADAPDVPTAAEQGFDVGLRSPFGIAGPKGMDARTVQILHDAFLKAMRDPSHDELLRKLGLQAWYKNPAEYSRWAVDTFRQEEILVRQAGLSVEN